MTPQEKKFVDSVNNKISQYSIKTNIKEAISKARNTFTNVKYNDGSTELVDTGIEHFLCSKSPAYFIDKYCYISVPNLGVLPFSLYYFQKKMMEEINDFRKYVLLKCRQSGLSTVTAFYCLWRCLFRNSESIAVVSKKEDAAQDFISKVKVSLDLLPDFLSVEITTQNLTRIIFANHSQLKAEARSANAGRSASLSLLVLDEAAFYGTDTMIRQIIGSAQPTLSRTGGSLIIISCYTADTWINTENGLEQIKDRIPLDCILGYNNIEEFEINGLEHHQKTNVLYDSGITPIKKLTFKNKNILKVSNIHPLYILDENGYPYWKQAKDIKVGDYSLFSMREKTFGDNDYIGFDWLKDSKNQWLVKYKLENFDGYITEDMSYFFGLLIGNGYYNEEGQYAIITNTDKEIVDFLFTNKHFKDFYVENRQEKNKCHYRVHGRYFIELLKHLGFEKKLAKEKTIPKRLMSMSRKNMIALLQGLFDSDGHVRNNRGNVGFTSTSSTLLEQVKMILSMFGIYVGQENWHLTNPDGLGLVKVSSFCGQIEFSYSFSKMFFEKIGFRIKRKQEAYNKVKHIDIDENIHYKHIGEYIKKINKKVCLSELGKKERKGWKCLSRHFRENNGCNRNNIKYFLDYFDGILNEDCDYKKIKFFYDKEFVPVEIINIEDGEEHTYDFVIPETRSLYANSIIGSNTSNGTSGEGSYYFEQVNQLRISGNSRDEKLVEVDWFEVPDFKHIFPKKGYNDTLHKYIKQDYFNNYDIKKEMRSFFHPIETQWKENSWLKEQHNTLGDVLFRQEVLHDFVVMGSSVFSNEILERTNAAVKEPKLLNKMPGFNLQGLWIWKNPEPKHRYILGVDCAKGSGKDSSSIEILDVENYEQVAEYSAFVSTPEFSRVIKKLATFYNQGFVVIESNGIGESVFNGVYMDVNDAYTNVYKQKINRNGITVMTGWITDVKTRQIITNKLIDYVSVDELWEGFKLYSSRVYTQLSTWIWANGRPDHAEGAHDDCLIALSLALHLRDKAVNAGQSFIVAEDGRLIDYSVDDPLTARTGRKNEWDFITSEEESAREVIERKTGIPYETYQWLISDK